MSTAINSQPYSDTTFNTYDIGENDTKKEGKAGKSGKSLIQEFMLEVSKAKAKAAEGIHNLVSGSNDPSLINQLNNNKAYQFLSDTSDDSTLRSKDVSEDDMSNMFQLMFKALDANKQSASIAAQSSAMHLLADMQMTQKVSQGTQDSVTKMQADIKKAKDAESDGKFWSIFTAVAIAVVAVAVTIAITVCTGGAAAPAAAAGDAALIGAVEGGAVAGGEAGGEAEESEGD